MIKGKNYTDAQISEIQKSLKLVLSESQKTDLNQAKRVHEARAHFLPKRNPPPGKVEELELETIEIIRRNAVNLINALEEYGYLLDCPLSLDQTIDRLWSILRYSEAAQKKRGKPTGKIFSNPAGRTPEIDRNYFISELTNIYKEITGKEARKPNKNVHADGTYGGPFFRFVDVCIRPVEKIGNVALAKAIETTFKWKKEEDSAVGEAVRVNTKWGEPNPRQK